MIIIIKQIFIQVKIKTLVIFAILFLKNSFSYSFDKSDIFSSNLPIVIIDRNGQNIPDSRKITVDMKIIYNGEGRRNYITDLPNNYNGKVGIELRGSSSKMFPKKQYGFETRDSFGNNLNVSLLGLPEENDWILSASYNDKTFIRDVLTFKLMNDLGHYASRYKYCELFFEDEYQGIYILFEKIKRDKNRIDIAELTTADSAGDDLTGGYIIKIDKMDAGEGNSGWQSNFSVPDSKFKITYQYHYPKPDEITAIQKTYIKNYVATFETIMASSQYADTIHGYSKYMDINSFVDMFIINELSKNVDSYRISVFLYKDKDSNNSKIFIGPVWDYNLGYGNADYYNGEQTSEWQLYYLTTNNSFLTFDGNQVPFWWRKLFKDEYFMKKVSLRWMELRNSILNLTYINNFIDSLANYIDEAQERNFKLWKILGIYVWPNPINEYILATYSEQVTYLKNWIRDRIGWIDWYFNFTNVEENISNISNKYELYQNFPNPFNPSTKIKFSIPSVGTRRGVFVQLKVYDILGNEVATLVNEEKSAGTYKTEFNGKNLSSGIYFYQLKAGNFIATKKLLLLK